MLLTILLSIPRVGATQPPAPPLAGRTGVTVQTRPSTQTRVWMKWCDRPGICPSKAETPVPQAQVNPEPLSKSRSRSHPWSLRSAAASIRFPYLGARLATPSIVCTACSGDCTPIARDIGKATRFSGRAGGAIVAGNLASVIRITESWERLLASRAADVVPDGREPLST